VDSIYQQVLEQWATAIGAGGELVLEVQGLKFAPANRLRKALEEIDPHLASRMLDVSLCTTCAILAPGYHSAQLAEQGKKERRKT